MAGRRGTISLENLKTVIYKYREKFKLSMPPISDSIYDCLQQELWDKFNQKTNGKALQVCIKRHKNYLFDFDTSQSKLGIENKENNPEPEPYIVTFEMSLAEYSNILPKTSIYRLLPSKWTNDLQDQIFFKTDIDCTFSFKNSYVPNDLQYTNIKCTGRCTQCDAILSLTIAPPAQNCVKVICEVDNFNKNFVHNPQIKNRLTSERKNKIKDKLKYEKALKVQHQMANEAIELDNLKQPTTFPTLINLRKMRHEARSALQFDKNVVLSLYAMAHCIPYETFIRRISLVPFYIYFWTDEQDHYYNEVLKNKHIILSIDATGSVFQPIEPPAANDFLKFRTPKHLFLYAVVAYTEDSSVPMGYMASQSHTTDTIATWLRTWLGHKDKPTEIISDDSSAILGAITKVFLNMDFSDYIKHCFDILEGHQSVTPLCYVRMDISHFIKKLYKQSCFDKASEKSKFFFINSIKLIQKLRSYEEVKEVIRNIITLSLHQYKCDINNSESKCDKAFESLKFKIENTINQLVDPINLEEEFDLVNTEDDKDDSVPLKFYDDMIETEKLYLQLAEPSNKKNDYFLPELTSTLKRLLKKLPLWGSVMNHYFKGSKDYASSSNVENHFKDIKTIYFDTKNQGLRLDEFLVHHHGYINGTIKLNASNLKKKRNPDKRAQPLRQIKCDKIKRAKISSSKCENDDFDIQSIFQDDPIEIENWRGLAVSTPKSIIKSKPIYVLQNGNVANAKGMENRVIITNTCAFDSVAQTFAVAYRDRKTFKDSVDEQSNTSDNGFLALIKELSHAKYNNKKVYSLRELLLLRVFKHTNARLVVDCACNVTKIFDEVCTNHLFISAIRQRCCSNILCPSQTDENKYFDCKYLPLNINIITEKGIQHIQEAFESYSFGNIAPKCQICHEGNVTFNYNAKDIVIFELHDLRIMFDDLPHNIRINDKQCKILSIIEYEPPTSEGIGHYRAHCYRADTNLFESYDDLYSKIQRRHGNYIMPHIIVYMLE